MEKKNILFLINDLGGGGAEKVLVNLVNHMDKNKYDITVRTVMNRGVNRQFLSKEIHYDYVFKKPFRGIQILGKLLPKSYLYKKIAKGDFDVIVVYLQGFLTKIVCHAPKNQKTINYQHFYVDKPSFLNSFSSENKMLKCLNSYNAIVSVSNSVKESFERRTNIVEKSHVIYNTYDIKRIKELANQEINNSDLSNSYLNICAIGTLDKRKAFDKTIRSLAKIKEENNTVKFKLFILGEGPEQLYLENLIRKKGMENSVFLVGYTTNPYVYLKNCDLFVSSSEQEGFATVAVESIILGTPVLTTRTSGMTEILGENNEYGIVVENNEESLYLGLKNLLSKPELLKQYNYKAKERSQFFSTEKSVKDVENLIDEILK